MTTKQKQQTIAHYFNNEIESEKTMILETETHFYIVVDTETLHSFFKFEPRETPDQIQHRQNQIIFTFAKIVNGLNFKK